MDFIEKVAIAAHLLVCKNILQCLWAGLRPQAMYSVPTSKSPYVPWTIAPLSTGENGVPTRGFPRGGTPFDAGAQNGVTPQGFSTGKSLNLIKVNGPKGLLGCYVQMTKAGVFPQRKKEGRRKKEGERQE